MTVTLFVMLYLTGCNTFKKMLGISKGATPTRTQIFLMYGESGMVGKDPVPEVVNDPHIMMLGFDGVWKQAYEPTHDSTGCKYFPYNGQHAGHSLGIAFAKQILSEHPDMKIGLVPCARNGRTIQELSAGGQYFNSCMERIQEAKKYGDFAGILIFQGINDAVQDTPVRMWTMLFERLIGDLRHVTGYVPVIHAQLMNYKGGLWMQYKQAQQDMSLPALVMVKTDGLPMFDEYHLNADGTDELGRRMAGAFLRCVEY